MTTTLKIALAKTAPIRISIAIPPENPTVKGHFIGHAKLRSKVENKELLERFQDFDGEGDADTELVRELYERFEGLGDETGELIGEAAFDAVLKGPLSAYLTPAVVQAYFEQYGEARRGNSGKRRSR